MNMALSSYNDLLNDQVETLEEQNRHFKFIKPGVMFGYMVGTFVVGLYIGLAIPEGI